MPFEIVRNDITKLDTDAIVNAANSQLLPGGGVCGAIFAAAGHHQLEKACRKIGHCDVGHAVITPGFDLPARYVIHTVGPIWKGGQQHEAQLLQSAYRSALELALRKRCKSIAFPLISAGIYGYPQQQALQIAVETIRAFLQEHDMHVVLVLFDRNVCRIAADRLGAVQAYIDDHYIDTHAQRRRNEPAAWDFQAAEQQALADDWDSLIGASAGFGSAGFPDGDAVCAPVAEQPLPCAAPRPCGAAPRKTARSLEDLLDHLGETFTQMLLRLIDEKGLTDAEVYKRANLDRKHFSKLRKEGCHPTKATVLALAVALELNLDQTRDLLAKVGHALSPCSKFDVIIGYFIESEIYDIYEINQTLFAFGQDSLGAGGGSV